jgi:hypothetical protein
MVFKFQLGRGDGCVGTVLAIPKPVWESWKHLLGDPEVVKGSAYSTISRPGETLPNQPIAWIFSFDLAEDSGGGPDRIRFDEIIATSAEAFSYWAIEVAPQHAMKSALSDTGIPRSIRTRLKGLWPELSKQVKIRGS